LNVYDNSALSFYGFIQARPQYKKFWGNRIAEAIFDFLAQPQNIYRMIDFSERDKPALGAVISDLEELYGDQREFALNVPEHKRLVGAMVCYILEPFGYVPVKQRKIPANSSIFFASASVYEKKNKPRLILQPEIKIKEIRD